MDSRNVDFYYRKTSQGGTGVGAISKSHHSTRGNSCGNINVTAGSRAGWSNRGGSKNQLRPDKQHGQNGMLSSGKKGDPNKMSLSKSV
jgi:hypothetical protein